MPFECAMFCVINTCVAMFFKPRIHFHILIRFFCYTILCVLVDESLRIFICILCMGRLESFSLLLLLLCVLFIFNLIWCFCEMSVLVCICFNVVGVRLLSFRIVELHISLSNMSNTRLIFCFNAIQPSFFRN